MGAVFVGGHATVADLQHVRIIPLSGASPFGDGGLGVHDLHHAFVGVVDIAGGAPQVAADLRSPLPHIVAAVLAEAVDDWAVGRAQGVAHLLVDGTHSRVGIEAAGTAPVVLEVVHAPRGVGLGVLCLVSVAAFVSSAGVGAGRGVDAELQPLGMHVVGEGLHVRKLVVGLNHPAGVAVALPGVIDVEVDVAGVAQSAGDHGVGHLADGLVVDATGEEVPTVPSYGRGFGQAVGQKIVQRWRWNDIGDQEGIGLGARGDEFIGHGIGFMNGDVQLVAF